MSRDITAILDDAYDEATKKTITIETQAQNDISYIVSRAENSKGIIAVLMTLMAYKVQHPEQDIRNHQAQIPNGFSGRSIDTNYVTPWIKSKNFPAMAESGWLTRSLEQAVPYNRLYSGSIKPPQLKDAFLNTVEYVQYNPNKSADVLAYYIACLIAKRDSIAVDLAKPHALPIATIIDYLEKHFTYHYSGTGASRLPVLAIYAAYQCMMSQVSRYNGKTLLPLESHNSADRRSGRIGDIDIWTEDGDAFEGVEVKHEIKITPKLITTAYEKFKGQPTKRYYILTTANMDSADWDAINDEIDKIRRLHGCQVIANGVYSTLKYYLRLLDDPAQFIDNYVDLMKSDETIKYQQKEIWNKIVNGEI